MKMNFEFVARLQSESRHETKLIVLGGRFSLFIKTQSERKQN